MRSTLLRLAASLLAPLLLAAGLTACDPAEQGRRTSHEKGVYQGAPDTKLTQQQLDQLRQRARNQMGS